MGQRDENRSTLNDRERERERGREKKKLPVCTAAESEVLRVFNLEMDRSRMWLYEAS